MYYIGIDIGTSSVKALLIDEKGQVIKTAVPEYSFYTPKPLWAEANPQDWWEALGKSVKNSITEAGISSSAGIHRGSDDETGSSSSLSTSTTSTG